MLELIYVHGVVAYSVKVPALALGTYKKAALQGSSLHNGILFDFEKWLLSYYIN